MSRRRMECGCVIYIDPGNRQISLTYECEHECYNCGETKKHDDIYQYPNGDFVSVGKNNEFLCNKCGIELDNNGILGKIRNK